MGKPTTKYSLKTIAHLFPPDSIERLYLHGKWQKKRGRRPSMRGKPSNMKWNRSPDEAFESAQQQIGDYLDQVHTMAFRRTFLWSDDLIAAVINRAPLEQVERMF